MRMIFSAIGGILLLGLCIAILRNFDWNVGEALSWVFGLVAAAINAVADFIQQNPLFEKYVHRN